MTRKLVVWMHAPGYPLWTIPAWAVERISAAAGEGWSVSSLPVPGRAAGDGVRSAPPKIIEEAREAEVYLGFGIPREVFTSAHRLRWIHSAAAGVGGSLFPELRDSNVLLTNSAGLHAEPLAEWAAAAILYFGRGFDMAATGKARHEWRYDAMAGSDSPLREVAGLTLGVIGYGGIGRAVARKATALGMRVVGLRRRAGPKPAELDALWGPDALSDLLAASDYVVLALPETESTRELIGARELAGMRPGSVLINLSRGGLVTEKSLVASLREGHLRGAALDVFATEPLGPDSPLWELDNVLITPHTGAFTRRFWQREVELVERNIRHYLAGEPLENLVDKQAGY